jgi:hypothetical protein
MKPESHVGLDWGNLTAFGSGRRERVPAIVETYVLDADVRSNHKSAKTE